ncbi:MAG: hypothetical protein ABJR46_11820 [Tateyamaria sp.]|uniref:hypothetical protein n=1 Tax=Tateyamaria sp. TaxID=1929288 RepID=UPI00329B9774
MTPQDRQDAAALFVLRLGLIWFIFLWAAHKIILPNQYRSLARNFDGVDPSVFQVYGLAVGQIVLCVLALVGIARLYSYGALLMMHAFTVSRRWEGFLDPFALNERGTFPIHRNQVIDLAVLAAFIALVLLRHRDHFSLGAWLERHGGGPRWWT